MAFGIWCEVSGGVTGYRTAWAKAQDRRLEFPTLDAAATEADRLQTQSDRRQAETAAYRADRGLPPSRVVFRYKARALI